MLLFCIEELNRVNLVCVEIIAEEKLWKQEIIFKLNASHFSSFDCVKYKAFLIHKYDSNFIL